MIDFLPLLIDDVEEVHGSLAPVHVEEARQVLVQARCSGFEVSRRAKVGLVLNPLARELSASARIAPIEVMDAAGPVDALRRPRSLAHALEACDEAARIARVRHVLGLAVVLGAVAVAKSAPAAFDDGLARLRRDLGLPGDARGLFLVATCPPCIVVTEALPGHVKDAL